MPRASQEPPYLRIVNELRRRIGAGELRAGDPVPSTRAIAREWGVALATATKALAALGQLGVVEAVPRVGTVVAAPRGPGASTGAREHELSRDRIVVAAVLLADAQGLEALSIRGVAARLGVPTMSLYRHIPSKEDLILAMTDAALGEDAYPTEPPAGWRARLELAARMEWRLFRRHPWLAGLITLTRPRALPNALRHAEWVLSALDGWRLDAAAMLQLHVTLHSYVQGIASNLEAEAKMEAESGLSEAEYMQTQDSAFRALAASGDYPVFARVLRSLDGGFDLDLDALFEFGLRPLLDGFTSLVEGR